MAPNSSIRYDELQYPVTRNESLSSFAKWKSPLLMIGLTLLACLTAIGHNFFYVYLDTKQVSEVPIPQS
jgi:hypothetical protein